MLKASIKKQLQTQFGDEHPTYTVYKWTVAINQGECRDEYWEFVHTSITKTSAAYFKKYGRPTIPNVLEMPVVDFIAVVTMTSRAVRALKMAVPATLEDKQSYKIKDFIKEDANNLWHVGVVTITEIKQILMDEYKVPENKFTAPGWDTK